jgi:hypothetical protein
VTIFNIGDYFLNNDRYLCKIINSSQDANGKLCFHVHIIDSNHFPLFYASDLEHHVFKHLGNNEEVAQTLYKLNDEEIARRMKYERQIRKTYSFAQLYGAVYPIKLSGMGDDKDIGD